MAVLATKLAAKPRERRRHQRVRVAIAGRYMLEDRSEYACQTVDMSPGGARLQAPRAGRIGERVIAYLETIGRIEGKVVRTLPGGFAMTIDATARKRDRLAAQLTWLANRHELSLPEDRSHDRIVPRNAASTLRLQSGKTILVQVADVSMTGAAIITREPIDLGSNVVLGSRPGQVTRFFDNGVAIRFDSPLPPEIFGPDIVL